MCEIVHGDCLEVMKTFSDNHFTSSVTDPPYGLKFMGKKWDHGIPGIDFWKEMLRICKPGSMLLAFGGTRTYHRLACAIEDAGWEIRDCLQWIYGSGFPKSHNNFGLEGYGTALKPAHEPIIMAMKPLDGTFAKNVQKWGLGGLNIDGSRVETMAKSFLDKRKIKTNDVYGKFYPHNYEGEKGRWPANILLDEEAAKQLDEQSGILKSGYLDRSKIKDDFFKMVSTNKTYGARPKKTEGIYESTSGGASRFFYCAKASPSERNGSTHPTVKPLKLMKYLINLIMPTKDGLLLDPFAGSGTTILAAKQLGFEAIGIEKEEEYVKISKSRIDNEIEKKDPQLSLLEKLYG